MAIVIPVGVRADESGLKEPTAADTVEVPTLNATDQINVAGTKVVDDRRTGWTAASGTAARTTFDTATVTTTDLAQRVKALLDDLIAHGLIGP